MKRRALVTALALMGVLSQSAFAEETYLSGRIIDVTSGPSGLLVRLETGVPGNCTGVSFGWMLISESNKTMIAAALLTWQNHSGATVYTNPLSAGNCTVNQFDPWD